MALVVQFGFKLADAGDLSAGDLVAGLQSAACGIAFGGDADDGLRALGGEGFKAGAGGGLGLRLANCALRGGKRIGCCR